MSFCKNCGHANLVHKKKKYRCDVPRCRCREFERSTKNYKIKLNQYEYPLGKIISKQNIERREKGKRFYDEKRELIFQK